MRLSFVGLVIALLAEAASGQSIVGRVSTDKEMRESQTPVVIWVEGLPANVPDGVEPVMSQSGLQFSPRVLTVVAGQTVAFPNDDDVAHNVFSLSASKQFRLGIYPKGESREVTFERVGVIDLFCSIHRHMHAVIVVTPSEHAVQTQMNQPFVIENVPPGEYTVKIWNSVHEIESHKVSVSPDQDCELNVTLSE